MSASGCKWRRGLDRQWQGTGATRFGHFAIRFGSSHAVLSCRVVPPLGRPETPKRLAIRARPGQLGKNMEENSLITFTADIVSAHVSNNTVAPADLPNLIQTVFDALASAGSPAPAVEERREPAVAIRSSVKPDAIACLECGAKMKMLKRHLSTDHSLTPAEYRTKWGLKSDYPLVAPDYAAKRAELAKKIGLGRKPGTKVAKGTKRKLKVPVAV